MCFFGEKLVKMHTVHQKKARHIAIFYKLKKSLKKLKKTIDKRKYLMYNRQAREKSVAKSGP